MQTPLFRIIAISMITTLCLVILFHISILSGIVPFDIVWGGKLTSADEMIVFELISILLNVTMLAIVLVHADIVRLKINPVVPRVGMWTMAVLFALNTVGNLFSENELEKIIFTPVTFVLAVCCVILARKKTVKPSLSQ